MLGGLRKPGRPFGPSLSAHPGVFRAVACARGGTLSCTDALPTHRALPHFLISSLAQGLGAVRLAWGRQHQPIIRRRPQRACPWAAFPILMAPSPSLGTPLAHPRPLYPKVLCDGSEVTVGGGLCKANRVFWDTRGYPLQH